MRLERKTLPAAVCALIVLALTASMVLAAYYGKGNFKDVFVNRKHCFNSDLLASVTDEEDAAKSSFRATNGGSVMICNYDLSTGEYNAFDMTFSLYAWLDRESKDESTEYYLLTVNGAEKKIISTNGAVPIFTGLSLAGNKASQCNITVSFNGEKAALSDYPRLCLYAIPDEPDYMTQKRLGGCLTPAAADSFSAVGEFDMNTEAGTEDYAAFPYEVTMSGRLDGKTGVLKIRWDATALTLMAQYNELPRAFDVTTEGNYRYISIPLEEDYYTRLTFLRVQEPAEGTVNPWTGSVTPDELKGFVQTEIVWGSTT